MAINHVYVDPVAGADSGDGSIGDPWETVQHAVDTITDGGAGNQINVKDSGPDVLVSNIIWTSYSPTNAANNPLLIRGYTSAADDGGVGEIDGDNAVANLFSTSSFPTFVRFIDMNLHNTTGRVLSLPADNDVLRCEISNGGSVETIFTGTRCRIVGSNIHSGTSGAFGINTNSADCLVLFSRIEGHDDWAIRAVADRIACLFNLIHDVESRGIQVGSDNHLVYGNTFVGNQSAGDFGINVGAVSQGSIILSNIIKDFGSGSGGAVQIVAGGDCLILGHNLMHGNASDTVAGKVVFGLDLTDQDVTTDPQFTDAAGDDYSVGPNAKAAGYPATFPGSSTDTKVDVGAVQRDEVAGGLVAGGLVSP